MQRQERDRVAAFLEGAVSTGVSSDEVAVLVTTTFRRIDRSLAPIIGQRGMAALYERCLHLSRPMHPWLPVAVEGAEAEMNFAALSAALASRPSVEAAAAGTQSLDSFRTLLATLIGESLTERLLRPVWATLISGTSAQDTKS